MKLSKHLKKTIITVCLLFAMINSYGQHEITIGSQTWMTKNLNVDKFRNGDIIPQATTAKEWKKAADEGQPAWCYYNNDANNDATYGKLYNWFAVNDPRGLCPAGWHVPSDADWKTLETYLGGNSIAAVKLRSTEWVAIGNSTNSSGFSALPGGTRFNISQFLYIGKNGYWWTSTSIDKSKAICRQISGTDTFVMTKMLHKKQGLSVRCIKD